MAVGTISRIERCGIDRAQLRPPQSGEEVRSFAARRENAFERLRRPATLQRSELESSEPQLRTLESPQGERAKAPPSSKHPKGDEPAKQAGPATAVTVLVCFAK